MMDKLLEVADQQASLSSSASPAADFDENLFPQFMLKNLVWDFIVSQGMNIYKEVRLIKSSFY